MIKKSVLLCDKDLNKLDRLLSSGCNVTNILRFKTHNYKRFALPFQKHK